MRNSKIIISLISLATLSLLFQNCSASTSGGTMIPVSQNAPGATVAEPEPLGSRFKLAYPDSAISIYNQTAILKSPTLLESESGETAKNFSITPALPKGLFLSATTGVISGTSSTESQMTSYSVTVTSTLNRVAAINFTLESVPKYQVFDFYNGDTKCAIVKPNNSIRCFGGFINVINANSEIPNSAGASMVATAQYHGCALYSGHVKCWGANDYGQLGNGTTVSSSTLVDVIGITTATKIEISFYSSCALLANGTIQCWGRNGSGELGTSRTDNSISTPVEVELNATAIDMSATADHPCAILNNHKVKCWGINGSGQLGAGYFSPYQRVPVDVVGLENVVQISASGPSYFVCAVLSTGKINCWGDNRYAKFTDVGVTFINSPAEMSVATDVKMVATGTQMVCYLKNDNSVHCLGAAFNPAAHSLVYQSSDPFAMSKRTPFAAILKGGSVIRGSTPTNITSYADY